MNLQYEESPLDDYEPLKDEDSSACVRFGRKIVRRLLQ